MTSTGPNRGEVGQHAGFAASPFSNDFVFLKLKNKVSLTVHKRVWARTPKLEALGRDGRATDRIDLPQISLNAGHAMINYLYSGNLDLLEWAGPDEERDLVQLKSLFEVYGVARTYELGGLEELTKGEIERVADNTDSFALIDAVNEAYPVPVGDDPWFQQHVKSRIKTTLQTPSALLKTDHLPVFGDGVSVLKMVLGCMHEVYADLLESRAKPPTPGSFEQIAYDVSLDGLRRRSSDGSQEVFPEFEEVTCSQSDGTPGFSREFEEATLTPQSRKSSRGSANAPSVSEIRDYFDTLRTRSRRGTSERQAEKAGPEPAIEALEFGTELKPELEPPSAAVVGREPGMEAITVHIGDETPVAPSFEPDVAVTTKLSTKTKKGKKKKGLAHKPEPVPETLLMVEDPAPVAVEEPTPVPETLLVVEELAPVAVEEPAPVPETLPTVEAFGEEEIYVPKKKKFKKKKIRTPEPEPLLEPESVPESGFDTRPSPVETRFEEPIAGNSWGFWGGRREAGW